jgi:ribose transport system permease protein
VVTARLLRLARADWFGPLAIILVGGAVMSAFDASFLSPFNIQVLLLAIAVNSVIAMAQMIIIAIGQMNLAIGAIGGLSAIAFAGMMQVWGLPPLPAAALALALGVAAGLANGLLIAATGISAFVVTLATLSIFKGADLGITRAQPFYGVPESVKAFGATTMFGPAPWLALPAALVLAGMAYLLNRQKIGRHILAVGGNPSAAELSGISIPRTILWAHGVSGFLAALAGLMLVARLQLGQPSIGDDWLILSFAAPVIGGAALAGGHVSVLGAFLGVVIVAIITQALVIFRIDPFFVQVVLGLLILWAVGLNRLREVRFRRSAARA